MATVTIANLIHRAEMETDLDDNDRPRTTLTWQHGIPVCVCGDDLDDTIHSHVTCDHPGRPVVVCQSCGTPYPIQENS